MSVFDQAVIRTTTRRCGSSDASTPRQESPHTSTQGDIGRPRSRATGTPARISSDPNHAHTPQHPHFPLAQKNKPTKAQSAAPFSFRIVVHQDTRSLFCQPGSTVDNKGHPNGSGTLSQHHPLCVALDSSWSRDY